MGEYTIDNSVSETVKARHDDEIVVLSLFDGISCAHVGLETAGFTNVTYYASEIDKWASAITRFNYPDTIELGDVCAITRSMLPEHVDLMIGGSPCFTGETLVLTKEGHKEIRDVVVGDYVLTHKRRWRKVTKTGSTPNQRTLNIRGYGNPGINATPNHPFYSRTRYTQWDNSIRSNIRLFNDPIWRSADTLNKTTYLGSVTTPQNMEPSKHDTNFWRMIGRYTGDGWYIKGRRIGRINSYQYALIICCGKHEKDELIEIMDNTGYHYGIVEERTGYKMRICSKALVEFVEAIGKGASNKKVHPMIWEETPENQKAYLDGYLSADGCKKWNGRTGAITTSKQLAYGIQQLVNNVYGQPCCMYYVKKKNSCIIEGRKVSQRSYYEIRFKKDARIQDKAYADGPYMWMPITQITPNEQTDTVYNLSVDEDESYTANNLIVHNCQDLSIAKNDRRGLDGERSGLFWEWVRLWEEIQPKYWILENVNSMPQEAKTIISTVLDVEPIMINSSLVSAQNRKRLFWTNIYTDFFGICHIPQPEDRGILLKHILENGNPAAVGKRGKLVVDDNPQKAPTIVARDYKGFGNQPMAAVMVEDKSYAIPSTYYKENVKSLEKRNKKGLIVTEQSLMDKLQELSPRVAGMTITNGRIRPYRDTKDKAGISEIGTIFSTEGKADTVTTNHPIYILDNAKVIVPEATIKGYAEAEEGDSIDLSYPNSKTRRGRVSKKAPSQMTQNNVGVLVRDESSDTGYTIRKLTPLEIERLFTLPDHYTAHGVDAKGKTINISNTQRYKALGNGFVCDVVAHIMSYMGVDDE